MEQAALQGLIRSYARNEHLEFSIPYEYLGHGAHYLPDFLVKIETDSTLILEIKGQEDDQDQAKHEAAQRWVRAVNRWGQMGHWGFHVNRTPQHLSAELKALAGKMLSPRVE